MYSSFLLQEIQGINILCLNILPNTVHMSSISSSFDETY